MSTRITVEQRRTRLGRRHHLAAATSLGVAGVAEAMVGLHATDPATPFLSARARVPGFHTVQLEAALYDDVSVVKHLCMRRTLFVQASAVLPLIQAGVSDAVAATQRRRLVRDLEAAGVATDGGRWLRRTERATVDALAERGPSTGAELSRAVGPLRTTLTYAPGKAYGGDVAVATRVLTIMAVEGKIRRGRPGGGWTSSQHRWVLVEEGGSVEGDRDPVAADEARREVLARWLRASGPATTADLAWWSGLGVRTVTRALAAMGAVEVEVEGSPAWVHRDDLDDEAPASWVALLPALDPTTMGWKERDWYLGEHGPRLFDRNGNAGPTVWCDGRIVGGWGQRPTGEVVVEVFDDVGREAAADIEAEADALQVWLKSVVVKPRFGTPTEKALRS
jgi:hypothetical protein